MWFKNLQLYRLPAPWNITREALAAGLARGPFHPCGSQDAVSRGWVPPRDGELVHAVGRQWLIALATETRILPATVVNQEVGARADKAAQEQGYRPGRKALREIRERVVEEFLPRAFTQRQTSHAWIDPEHGWLGVDAASLVKADALLEHLHESLDDLPLTLPRTRISPTAAMTDWLLGDDAPGSLTIDRDCELRSASEEKSAVRYVRHPLEGAEIKEHISAGKFPTRLALTWNDRLSFILTEKGEIKRLTFLDLLKEELDDVENADELFDAEFALMTGEFTRFIPALIDALGGLADNDSLPKGQAPSA
jgi:recombination associated protein RdgC